MLDAVVAFIVANKFPLFTAFVILGFLAMGMWSLLSWADEYDKAVREEREQERRRKSA